MTREFCKTETEREKGRLKGPPEEKVAMSTKRGLELQKREIY